MPLPETNKDPYPIQEMFQDILIEIGPMFIPIGFVASVLIIGGLLLNP